MKNQETDPKQQIQVVKPLEKRTRKNKAECSKASKSSHYTRRRHQPDSSQQYLLPAEIPKSKGTQSIVTEGFENQLSKVVIRIPYGLLNADKFVSVNCVHVQNLQILIKIEKQLQNISVLARSIKQERKMQIENQIKINEQKRDENCQNQGVKIFENIQQNSLSSVDDFIVSIGIWGRSVYLSGFEPINRVIKKIRKDLSLQEDSQIMKFKAKDVNSDLFIYLNLRLQEQYTTDYNGLINQGNTCYMNSYLQTLYHIAAFRNLVYEAQTVQQTRFPATLQQLFYNLSQAQKPVSPDLLVKSFGWGKQEINIQQDAQQFSCLFFQALEKKLNESAPQKGYRNRTIEGLFKGQLIHYLRCSEVGTVIYYTDFRRENYEEFIDLQLSIYPTLAESLDAYTTEVHMFGENKYRTEEYGEQQAYKGVKIAYFPPILMIQLKRFQYDFESGHNIKILSSFEYQEQFDFSPWSVNGEKQVYELYAVLVHEGAKAESGHYYNFVKIGDQWYKFNDELVQKVGKQKALSYNFGGYHESVQFDSKEMKVNKKLVDSKITAYMLVYIKKQMKKDLMTEENILPEWIEKKNNNKLQIEELRKNKRKFLHNVALIDWEKSLEDRKCSDMGFLDPEILQAQRQIIEKIPKQTNMIDWLAQQNIISQPQVNVKKKPTKKNQKIEQKSEQQKSQAGIYVYYVTSEKQNLVGFIPKYQHKMEDLLKVSIDQSPIILKAPCQAKKQQYLAIIKKFKVQKINEKVEINFTYKDVLPIKKNITYQELQTLLADKFIQKPPLPIDGNYEDLSLLKKYKFYIDDGKFGPIKLIQYSGPIPNSVPSKNQLLVCVFEEMSSDLTLQEEEKYSFSRWYKIKKETIDLIVVQQKGSLSMQLKDVHDNMTLAELRKLIFEKVLKEQQLEYGSPQNIVLRARLKKGSKVYSQVAEPECSSLKDLIKYENRVEFSFSSLTVESRLSQFVVQFYHRLKNFKISDPIQIVVNRNDESQVIVKSIKKHQRILQFLKADGFEQDDAELLIFSKDWASINDIVNNQGKVIGKGEFNNFLKNNKNLVLVVEGRTTLNCQTEQKIQINEEEFEPYVYILLHHTSQSYEKVGIPRFLRVDRRMQLFELREKILDLIKDQMFGWEGKIHLCNPFKTQQLLFAKGNKRPIDLSGLQSYEEMKRLKIEQKKNNTENNKKKSKEIKNSAKKESLIEDVRSLPLKQIKQQTEGQNGISVKEQKMSNIEEPEVFQNNRQVDLGKQNNQNEEGESKQEFVQGQEEEEAIEDVRKISGPETIYGLFPKVRVLKMQIVHFNLIKPNVILKLNVDN